MTEPTSIEQLWDEKYSEAERVWSGEPNGVVVDEVGAMVPSTVLDVGCGEGADAVWLSLRGWDVTALDVSGVALRRAEQAATETGAEVRWLHAGLLDAGLPAEGFDLVIALYPALLQTPEHAAEQALLDSVAPRGTLVFVHHDVFGTPPEGSAAPTHGHEHGHDHESGEAKDSRFTPANMVGVEDMKSFLHDRVDEWQIETHEQRSRDIRGGAGAHFSQDVVLRARRLV